MRYFAFYFLYRVFESAVYFIPTMHLNRDQSQFRWSVSTPVCLEATSWHRSSIMWSFPLQQDLDLSFAHCSILSLTPVSLIGNTLPPVSYFGYFLLMILSPDSSGKSPLTPSGGWSVVFEWLEDPVTTFSWDVLNFAPWGGSTFTYPSWGCEMALFLMKFKEVSQIKLFFKAIEELRVQRNLKITKLWGTKSLLGEQKSSR